MKTINFNQKMKDLEGKDALQNNEPIFIKGTVANLLIMAQKQADPIRLYDLAMRIYKANKAIDIEDSDIKTIKDLLKQSGLSVLASGQILKLFV